MHHQTQVIGSKVALLGLSLLDVRYEERMDKRIREKKSLPPKDWDHRHLYHPSFMQCRQLNSELCAC